MSTKTRAMVLAAAFVLAAAITPLFPFGVPLLLAYVAFLGIRAFYRRPRHYTSGKIPPTPREGSTYFDGMFTWALVENRWVNVSRARAVERVRVIGKLL